MFLEVARAVRWEEPSWLAVEELDGAPFLDREPARAPGMEATGLDAAELEGDALMLSREANAASLGWALSLQPSGGGVAEVGEADSLVAMSPKMRARAAL